MFNLRTIALVGGAVVCAVGFLLFIPMITEIIYQSESWQSYAVPILLYLIVGGALVITNRNLDLKISNKDSIFMHCLPAKVDFEVSKSVFDSTKSIVWKQAYNRMIAQKKLLQFINWD
mgnify:CR=1 FL=1